VGASKAADTLSQYWIKRAEQYHPVIDIGAGNLVTVVFQKGFRLETLEDAEDQKAKEELQKAGSAAQNAVAPQPAVRPPRPAPPQSATSTPMMFSARPASCASVTPSTDEELRMKSRKTLQWATTRWRQDLYSPVRGPFCSPRFSPVYMGTAYRHVPFWQAFFSGRVNTWRHGVA
jgi:hypothetical protein